MKILQLQTHVYEDKKENLAQLTSLLAAHCPTEKPDLVMLGEMFACPYENRYFPLYAEPDGGETQQRLAGLAAKHGIYLAAGSIPEKGDEGMIYNTAYVFNREGRQIAKHRKAHLFDINVEGGQSFRESDTLAAGNTATVFDTEFGRMGLCICFDCRFPELIRLMVLRGARVILVPAAFNMTTGPAHWDIMFRSRAIDNQCFMVGTSPARDENFSYHAWGHSIIVSPWGTVLSEMDEKEDAGLTEIDLSEISRIRCQLPLLSARRTDIYQLLPEDSRK